MSPIVTVANGVHLPSLRTHIDTQSLVTRRETVFFGVQPWQHTLPGEERNATGRESCVTNLLTSASLWLEQSRSALILPPSEGLWSLETVGSVEIPGQSPASLSPGSIM